MIDFTQPADVVAPQLLGAVIWRGPVGIELTEVEAYLGEADPASHAYKGLTQRCATMFGPPGHLYVYASYGIHRAGNLVCSPEGTPGGVLLRAGRVIAGHEVVRERRGPKPTEHGLARGPGNLGACLGLDLHLNGSVVAQMPPGGGAHGGGADEFALDVSSVNAADHAVDNSVAPNAVANSVDHAVASNAADVEGRKIRVGKRIGITKNADAPLRFWIAGDRTVSSPRR